MSSSRLKNWICALTLIGTLMSGSLHAKAVIKLIDDRARVFSEEWVSKQTTLLNEHLRLTGQAVLLLTVDTLDKNSKTSDSLSTLALKELNQWVVGDGLRGDRILILLVIKSREFEVLPGVGIAARLDESYLKDVRSRLEDLSFDRIGLESTLASEISGLLYELESPVHLSDSGSQTQGEARANTESLGLYWILGVLGVLSTLGVIIWKIQAEVVVSSGGVDKLPFQAFKKSGTELKKLVESKTYDY